MELLTTTNTMLTSDCIPDKSEDSEAIPAEALCRDAEMEAGLVQPLSYEDFMAAIQ